MVLDEESLTTEEFIQTVVNTSQLDDVYIHIDKYSGEPTECFIVVKVLKPMSITDAPERILEGLAPYDPTSPELLEALNVVKAYRLLGL